MSDLKYIIRKHIDLIVFATITISFGIVALIIWSRYLGSGRIFDGKLLHRSERRRALLLGAKRLVVVFHKYNYR